MHDGRLQRVYARRTLATAAQRLVAPVHGVHVGTRAAQVADVALEVGHLRDGLHLAQDARLRPAGDELALVRRDGAEGTTAEAAAMQGDGVAYHLVGGDALAAILGMGQARVGQVVDAVQLLGGGRRAGRVDHHRAPLHRLQQARGGILVALLLDVAEVLGLPPLVAQAVLVGVEHDVVRPGLHRSPRQEGRLRQVGDGSNGLLLQAAGQQSHGLLAHAVDQHVGPAVHQDAGAQAVLPVVVVRQPPHAGLDAPQDDGHVGVEAFQYLRVDHRGILGPHVGPRVGRIGIVAAQALVGGVLVHHRVHAPRTDAEEQPRPAQFAEVAQVVAPVGLRHDGHAQPLGLQDAPYDSRAEGGVVDVGIGTEQYHVQLFPPVQLDLLLGRRKPVGQSIVFHIKLIRIRTVQR